MCDCNHPHCLSRQVHRSAAEGVGRRLDLANSQPNVPPAAAAPLVDVAIPSIPSRPATSSSSAAASAEATLQNTPQHSGRGLSDSYTLADHEEDLRTMIQWALDELMDWNPPTYEDEEEADLPPVEPQVQRANATNRGGHTQNSIRSRQQTPFRNLDARREVVDEGPSGSDPRAAQLNNATRRRLFHEQSPVYDVNDSPTPRNQPRNQARNVDSRTSLQHLIVDLHLHPSHAHYPHFHPMPNTDELRAIHVVAYDEAEALLSLPGGSKCPGTRNPHSPVRQYADENARLKSFKNWRKWIVRPARLAFAGFYYLGFEDKVECFSCRIRMADWNNMDPVLAHIRLGKFYCKHLYQILTTKLDLLVLGPLYDRNPTAVASQLLKPVGVKNIINRHGGAAHKNHTDPQARLDTFQIQCWVQKPGYPTKDELALQGFFCQNASTVICYYCSQCVVGWPTKDGFVAPEDLHAMLFPQCFLSMIRGLPRPTPLLFTPEYRAPPNVDHGNRPPERIDPTRPACRICDEFEGNIVAVDCGHVLGCMHCLLKFKTNHCPFCRADIGSVMALYI